MVDKTEKVYTIQKDNVIWVIHFYLNDDQKSGLDITLLIHSTINRVSF